MRLRIWTVLYELFGMKNDTGISCGTVVTNRFFGGFLFVFFFKHTKIHTFTSGMYICTESSFGLPSTRKILINWSKFSRVPSRWLGLKHLNCEERLKELRFFSLQKGRLETSNRVMPGFFGRCTVKGRETVIN